MQRYLLKKLRVSKLSELLQRVRITRQPALSMEESEVPNSKRPRLEEEEQGEKEGASNVGAIKEGGPRFPKRRKCILLMAYNGSGYLGMQRNPGVPTIEEELLEALTKAGAFPEDMKENLGKLQFQRCARTDKGVSAARQVVSIKISSPDHMTVTYQLLIPRVNSYLPEKIQVIALKRVTKSFDSRHSCSARTYEYVLPTYAFAPYHLSTLDYRIDDQTVAKVTELLGQYAGTHNFHNFTSGVKFEQMSSNRFIISFECGKPFLAHSTCNTCKENREVEFIVLKVKGQSFMIHQIRKMIGLVIAIVRGRTEETLLQKAYGKEKVDIPRAPGLGLLLENVHFERYNVRISGDGIHELLDWTAYDEEVEKFKREMIHQPIIDTEIDEMSMSQWLGSLQIHDFHQTAARLRDKLEAQQPQLTSPNIEEAKMESSTPPDVCDSQGQPAKTSDEAKVGGEREREKENAAKSEFSSASNEAEVMVEQAVVENSESKPTLSDSLVLETSTADTVDTIDHNNQTSQLKSTLPSNCAVSEKSTVDRSEQCSNTVSTTPPDSMVSEKSTIDTVDTVDLGEQTSDPKLTPSDSMVL